MQILQIEQGTTQWLDLRKTKITATDASVIIGAYPWKTAHQLYHEKISDTHNTYTNSAMQRGIDLEPMARDLFMLETGIDVSPAVIVRDWAMASLDGISSCGKYVVEIKCPGKKTHEIALSGKIPDYYYPQLQHQMYVCDVDEMYYYSFDGMNGVVVVVVRDDEFIEKMIVAEKHFYDCIINKIPPVEYVCQ